MVDRKHHDELERAMVRSGRRQEFGAKVKRVKGVAGERSRYALMVLQPNGDCGFLDADRLCSVQKRYGADVLPNTCNLYPRVVTRYGDHYELSGLTSCPEITRQLLLHADSMDYLMIPGKAGEGMPVRATVPPVPERTPYGQHGHVLRGLMLDLLSLKGYPLASRLFLMSYFANRTASFLTRDSATLDDVRLLQELERIQDGRFQAALHTEFANLPVDPTFPSRLVLAVLTSRAGHDDFQSLLDAVIEQYGGRGRLDAAAATRDVEGAVRYATEAYAARRKTWEPYAERIDGYFAQLAKNYWASELYTGSPNLLAHMLQLLGRLVTLRFLLLGSPLLGALADAPDSHEGEKKLALDRAVVQVVHTFSRIAQHNPKFRKALSKDMADANVISLAHAACLAKY